MRVFGDFHFVYLYIHIQGWGGGGVVNEESYKITQTDLREGCSTGVRSVGLPLSFTGNQHWGE